MQRCAPKWLLAFWRITVVCDASGHAGGALVGLLAREARPNTIIFHVSDAYRYGTRVLLQLWGAASLWAGSAIACRGLSHGLHGGPIGLSALGVLYRRSFLDTRLAAEFKGHCRENIDVVTSAFLNLKGVHTRIVGNGFLTRRLRRRARASNRTNQACRDELAFRYRWLWVSRKPDRVALFITLLDGTDSFLLDLTIRYAVLQSRKPDELVLLLPKSGILEDVGDNFALVDGLPTDVEVELGGPTFGSGAVRFRTLSGSLHEGPPLSVFLKSRKNRAGCVARVFSKFGPPRTLVLSVVGCADDECAVQAALLRSFELEHDPGTALMFASAERLINERLVEDNLRCISLCEPNCGQHTMCGQSPSDGGNALYDLSFRRSAGYNQYEA